MDVRVLILLLAFLFLVGSVVYLFVAIVRARRAARVPPPAPEVEWPMLKPAPPEIEAAAREDRTFAEPTGGMAAVLNQPLRTGQWRPDSSDAELPRTSTAEDYWDTLIEEESLLVRPSGAINRRDAERLPDSFSDVPFGNAVDRIQESVAEEGTSESTPPAVPESVPTPAPSPEPTRTAAPSPEPGRSTADWIDDLVAQLETTEDEQPKAPEATEESVAATQEVVPDSQPVAPQPAPEQPPAPTPVPEQPPAPTPVPEQPPAPTPAPEQPPAPTPVPEQPPAPTPVPEQPPAPTPVPEQPPAPRPVVVVPPTPVPPATESRPRATRPPQDSEIPRPAVVVRREERVDAPEHVLVAPVEMWFGDVRIGVKPGSRTYDRFQKIADVLFEDLRRSGSHV